MNLEGREKSEALSKRLLDKHLLKKNFYTLLSLEKKQQAAILRRGQITSLLKTKERQNRKKCWTHFQRCKMCPYVTQILGFIKNISLIKFSACCRLTLNLKCSQSFVFRHVKNSRPETARNMMNNLVNFLFQLTPIETDFGLPTSPHRHRFSVYQFIHFFFSIKFCATPRKKAVKISSIIKNPGNKKMAGTGDIMIQLFSCCIQSQPSPTRRRHHQRLRIDRSMIGNPTNFVHTGKATNSSCILTEFKATISKCFAGHIGSNDAELSSQHLTVIQSQMQSKGGYDINSLRMQV